MEKESNINKVVEHTSSSGFMSDSKGNPSSMRLMCVVCVIAGVVQSFIGVWEITKGNQNAMQILTFAGTLIAAGFTGKFIQKTQEIKE